MNGYRVHVVSRDTLSCPGHSFAVLPDVSLRGAAQVARVISLLPGVYHTSIRSPEPPDANIFHEFDGLYRKGRYVRIRTIKSFDSDRPCGSRCPYPVADCFTCDQAPINAKELS